MINPTLLTINLQFKDLGNIFGSFGDLSGKRFKKAGSYDDFQNYLKDSFNATFGVGSDGISKFNSEQIEAKANVLGLNKELRSQALALASDATLSAKAATGKLTYADAIKDSVNNAPVLVKALQNQGKLTLEQEDLLGKLKEGSAEYNEQVKKIINANAELGDSIVELPESASKAGTAFSNLSNYFKGLLATLKTMLPLIAAVGAAFVAYRIFKWADNKYNLTYDTNLKNVKEHVTNLQNAQKEVENLNAKADQYKQTLQEIASNYDITLEGTESVDEMIDKIQSANGVQLTLVDQTEIEKIQLGNDELERTLNLKEQLVTSEQRKAANDAKDLLKKAEYMDMPEQLWSLSTKSLNKEMKNFFKNPGVDVEKYTEDDINYTKGSLESYLAYYHEYQDLLDKAIEKQGEKGISEKNKKKAEKDEKKLQKMVDSIEDELQDKASDFTDILNGLSVNGEGLTALSGYEPYFEKVRKMLRSITDKDLTDAQKALNSLSDFFDGSFGKNALKAELKESAGSAEELQKALAGMGLTLDDIGIDNISDLQSYLQETASSAEDAADAINTVEGSVASVTSAFNADNQDVSWKTMAEYLAQADELFANGQIGTDDFKEAAQFMTQKKINPDDGFTFDAQAYEAAWKEAQDKVKRYFDNEDQFQSAENFLTDLQNVGLAIADGNNDFQWTENFNSSADAADKLGISVSAVEVLMHNLEAYGAEFDDMLWSGDVLDQYKSALNGIKTIYDEQLKLLDAAIDDLYIASHPQYQFTTSLDNFLALADYEDYIKNINQGDYLWLTVDNKVVKLRVVEIQYNPLIADNSIQITFSNMIQGRSSRNDLSYVLNTPSNASKSSASGSSNNFLNNEGITLTAGLIQKLISNGAFKNGVSQIINNEFAGMLAGGSISLEELNAKIIKVTDLYGKNGYFEYLQAKLITAGRIVADSADFKELSALAATIKSAIIGASSTETGIVINLTTENATMSEAMIKDLIAKYITVNELKAGDIYTNKIKILSENGTLRIQDNTFSIYDEDGNVVVQLGEDKNGNYGLIISDSKGSVLLDSQGLHEGIVPDDFIKTDMIADGQITESKIDKTTMRDWTMPDGSKVFDVSHLWDGDDSFGKSYNTIKSTVSATSKELGDLSDKVDQLGNGYTVVLSNETQNIPCTSDGITAASFLIEIPFYGYEGIKQAVCTVTVGELPDGITLAENVDSTSTAPGKITLNVAKGKTLGNKSLLTGTIVFTCTVAGKKISKKFTWIKSLAGKDGSQGIPAPTYYTWIRYADTPTSGMSDDPTNKTYIGIAYNQTSQTPSSNYSDYQWSKFRGDDGASIKGDDGKTLYVWIKYADDAKGTNMSDAPEGKTYMGMAWNKPTSKESTNAADYSWSLIKGADGKTPVKGVDYFDGVSSYVWIRYATDAKGTGMTAIPSTTTGYIGTATTTIAVAPTNASAYVWAKYVGEKGAKGDGSYIHIAYANSADGKTGFDTTIGTGKSYIGQYTDNIEDDSTNPSKYTWSLIKGADGKTLYTWLKYADSPTSGMSDSPYGKMYMGIAVNKTSITESSNYSDYTWSLIKGTDGISVKGDKGDTVYIWVKYADDAKGNGMSEYPDGKKYIGLAYNKTTATESNNASDYIWSLIQGEDAVLYEIEPSVAVIKKCTLDVCSITDESGNRIVDEQGRFLSGYFLTDSLSPNKITFTAYKQVGSKTRATYACRFIIQESLNGLSWSTKYTSSKDETSVSYTPSTLKLQQIKCVMYRAGGITEQLDSQTVPVIQDAEGYDSVIQTFTDTFASVELKVDNNAKAITLKAEQKDITNAINNYDNTTVKDIRNRQTEQKVNIDGISTKVSDIETTINGSADGTKTGLIEKVTQVTTKAGTIEANLKNNYTTTAGMNTQISNSIAASADKIKVTLADGKTESTLKAALGEIQKSVKDNAGNISTVTQKANSLETKVTNQGNDIANLKVDAKAVETLVGSSAGTTDVVQKATDFRKTITDAAGNANLALSTANSNKNIISNMKVGAANTIRNSNDLIYDLYFMVASLLDESGNHIVAETGDRLIAYY